MWVTVVRGVVVLLLLLPITGRAGVPRRGEGVAPVAAAFRRPSEAHRVRIQRAILVIQTYLINPHSSLTYLRKTLKIDLCINMDPKLLNKPL